jgi:hypothetical protein
MDHSKLINENVMYAYRIHTEQNMKALISATFIYNNSTQVAKIIVYDLR